MNTLTSRNLGPRPGGTPLKAGSCGRRVVLCCAGVKLFWFRSTPNLARYLSDDEQQRSLVLIEVQPDVETGEDPPVFRLDLVCTLQAIRFRHGGTRRASYYVGAEGGQIDLHVERGDLVSWSPPLEITAEYSAAVSRSQNLSFGLKPGIKADESGGLEASAAVKYERGDEHTLETKLSGVERTLNVIPSKHHIRWDLASLRVHKVIQDFVNGPLAVFATAKWPVTVARKGWIEAVPDRVEFYDSNRKRLGFIKSALMWRVLRRQAGNTVHRDGCKVEFEIADDER